MHVSVFGKEEWLRAERGRGFYNAKEKFACSQTKKKKNPGKDRTRAHRDDDVEPMRGASLRGRVSNTDS